MLWLSSHGVWGAQLAGGLLQDLVSCCVSAVRLGSGAQLDSVQARTGAHLMLGSSGLRFVARGQQPRITGAIVVRVLIVGGGWVTVCGRPVWLFRDLNALVRLLRHA